MRFETMDPETTSLSPAFRPLPFLTGGHRQTVAGHIFRAPLAWRHPTRDVVLGAPDEVKLLLRVSRQPQRERPALLLIHGLEGCDRSGYMLSAGDAAYRAGWHVVRMNLRGCGDALSICPRLYNAGVTTDLLAVLDWLASEVSRIALCGFSLGANLALLTLARHRDAVPSTVGAVAAVCPPLDLAAAADRLARPGNRIYQLYFLGKLKDSYRRRQRLLPETYEPHLERGRRTVREYDDAIVAPYGGYRDADDYYARSSAGSLLTSLDRPTLILSSGDDPMIPLESVLHWPVPPCVQMETTSTGGHVGFVGKCQAPGSFWAAARVTQFFRETLGIN